MKLLSLSVKGHNKYKLNPKMHSFTYTPDKHYQVLLGSNGAGKSTTASLLYPYPESNSMLESGGYVRQVYQHEDNTYLLIMEKVGNHTQYSFLKNDEELNTSGKVSVQQTLVIETFGITKDIQRILTDVDRFTEMSPAAYKKWITLLSSTDYDYVLTVHGILKKKLSYVNNVLKHNQKKRVLEVEKMADTDRDKLFSEVESLKQKDKKLMDMSTRVATLGSMEEIDTDKLIVLKKDINNALQESETTSIDALYEDIDNAKGELVHAKATRDSVYKRQEALANDVTEYFELEDIPEEADLLESKEQLEEALSKYPDTMITGDSQVLYNEIHGIKATLTDKLTEIPVNNHYFSVKELNEKREQIHVINNDIKSIETVLTKLAGPIAELDHLKEHGEVECPKCSHKWYQTYNIKEHEHMIEEHKVKTNIVESLMRKLTDTENYITEAEQYYAVLNVIRKLKEETPNLSTLLWDRISSLVSTEPTACVERVKEVHKLLSDNNARNRLLTSMKDIEKQLTIRRSIKDSNSDINERTRIALEKELSDSLDDIERLHITLENFRFIEANINTFNTLLEKAKNSLRNNDEYIGTLAETKWQEIIRTESHLIKNKLYNLQQHVTRCEVSDLVIKDLDEQIEKLVEEQEVLKTTIKELSPENGLIGLSLTGFLGVLVSNMNHYLDQVWSHDMVLHPPGIVNNKLAWKFPITIGSNPVPDIAEMSSGEKNMVNLSFKLIMMHILNLSGHMLILDEFGTNLDTEHRNKSMRFVTETLRDYEFSNIYVISHYSEAYKTFPVTDTDYSVLHDTNITTGGLTISDCLITE